MRALIKIKEAARERSRRLFYLDSLQRLLLSFIKLALEIVYVHAVADHGTEQRCVRPTQRRQTIPGTR
jgi:hypothetical protein